MRALAAAAPAGAAPGPAGDDAPVAEPEGTKTCCPSPSFAARFTAARFARGRTPPARSIATATRAPAGSEYRPGRATAPATSTQISRSFGAARGRGPAAAGAAIEML